MPCAMGKRGLVPLCRPILSVVVASVVFALAQPSAIAADVQDVSTARPAACLLRVVYALKRPTEAETRDPFYAALLEPSASGEFARAAGRIVMRTEMGLYVREGDARYGGSAVLFTLPTHERIVSAWIDASRSPDGSLTPCDPTGAFFAPGYEGEKLTKLGRVRETNRRNQLSAESKNEIDFGFGLRVKSFKTKQLRVGQRVPLPSTCDQDDRRAAIEMEIRLADDGVRDAPSAPSVAVEISPLGTAMDVDIAESAGSRARDDAMLAAARVARYIPARWHCVAVPDRLIVKATFG